MKRRYNSLHATLLASMLAIMAAEWTLLVAGTKRDEMIVGAACLLASILFLRSVHRSSTLHLDFRLTDVATCWRLPWYLATDVYVITAVLLRDILGLEKAGSFYRVAGFKTSKDDPRLVARRVLATLYTTTTPNSIVVDIDYRQSRMLFHQLQRSNVTKMAEKLGARP